MAVKTRMESLLTQLNTLETEYNKAQKQQTGLASILRVQQVTDELKENNLKSLQESILDNIRIQLEEIRVTAKHETVLFEFNQKEIKDYIATIGKVKVVSNHKDRNSPVVVSETKHGISNKTGEFYGPTVLAIHPNSGNIFIGNYDGQVHVFNSRAEFIYSFKTISSGYAMDGIAFYGDYIFVSFYGYLEYHSLRGELICTYKITTNGLRASITILNKILYMCGVNNSAFCKYTISDNGVKPIKFSCRSLNFFSTHESRDIKSTPEGNLAVLYNKTPFVITYSTQGDILTKPLDNSPHLKNPEYFAIDSHCNFIISDDFIKIFESSGNLVHTIGGPSNPGLITFALGIDIDNNGRIVNICGKKTQCLQFFLDFRIVIHFPN